MKNRTPVPVDQRHPVPDFTPVPRRYRFDGWTAERQRAFIGELAQTGSVAAAARRINMSAEGAYYLRRQPGAEGFCAAWSAALAIGVQRLTDIAIDRAVEGVPVPIFHKGEQVGEKRWYNDRLLMFVMRHHLPDAYGITLNGGTRSKATIEREAAEHCPNCRAAREREAEETSDAAREAWLEELLKRYLIKVRQEYECRRDGRWYSADFYLRQLTHLELMLDTGGRAGDLIDHFTANPDGREDGTLYASPISRELAARRAAHWATTGQPPRPPLRLPRTMTGSWIESGPSMTNRHAARKRCEASIAAAQDEWEATRSEDSWAAWCAGRERDGR